MKRALPRKPTTAAARERWQLDASRGSRPPASAI
jgi:hypothetical protein